jgi:copper homeostasis protein
MKKPELEICVDTVHSAIAAERGGAQRVELCAALSEGGLTPSWALIGQTRKQLNIALHVLIRPRRGDFLYSDLELEIMRKDIEMVRQLGADGVVLGVLQTDGQVDVERTGKLLSCAGSLSVTFHRAFDMTPDPYKALEDLKRLQVSRLLTSGQQSTAMAGAGLIGELVKAAGDQLMVMPGGGIHAENVAEVRKKTGAYAFHASARSRLDSKMHFRNPKLSMGGNFTLSEYESLEADPHMISSIRKALDAC